MHCTRRNQESGNEARKEKQWSARKKELSGSISNDGGGADKQPFDSACYFVSCNADYLNCLCYDQLFTYSNGRNVGPTSIRNCINFPFNANQFLSFFLLFNCSIRNSMRKRNIACFRLQVETLLMLICTLLIIISVMSQETNAR